MLLYLYTLRPFSLSPLNILKSEPYQILSSIHTCTFTCIAFDRVQFYPNVYKSAVKLTVMMIIKALNTRASCADVILD